MLRYNLASASLIALLLPSLAPAGQTHILSPLKQEGLKLQHEKNALTSSKLRFDWVEPVLTSYKRSKSTRFLPHSDTRTYSFSFNQPVFKSGGIWFAVSYANANEEFLQLATKLQEKTLVAQALGLIFNLQKVDLQRQKQQLLIQNAEIDVFKKKEQYNNALIDITFLNNAILQKNTLKNALIDLESTHDDLSADFSKLSDMDYALIKPVGFTALDKEDFLRKNIELQMAEKKLKTSQYFKKMTVARFLPTVSLNFAYTDKEIKNGISQVQDTYKSYGFAVSIPFSINALKEIELTQIDYLQANIDYEDSKRSSELEYTKMSKRVKKLRQKEAIASEDLHLYDSLLQSVQDKMSIGEAISEDVTLIQNSKKTKALDLEIISRDIQISLLNIVSKMDNDQI